MKIEGLIDLFTFSVFNLVVHVHVPYSGVQKVFWYLIQVNER
jgi:hypothetical protein